MKFVVGLLVVFYSVATYSQELNCQVSVNSSQVQTSEKSVFEQLQKDIYEFMNNRKWTNYNFLPNEKIECNILITINSWDNLENFSGTIQVQSRRPVYNSNYSTTMLNYMDKEFTFKYLPTQPLELIENTFTSNLTAVLGFYAYLIIGLDFDSFTSLGGTPFYEKAQAIVNTAQNAPDKGWKSFESQRNRYWLVENLLNPAYSDVRKAIYMYHREGFDVMADDVNNGRQQVGEALKLIQKVYRQRPGLFIINLYMTAKSEELINLYNSAPAAEKMPIVNILKSIDPANSAKYNEILNKN